VTVTECLSRLHASDAHLEKGDVIGAHLDRPPGALSRYDARCLGLSSG
jgi:hypothetical protein